MHLHLEQQVLLMLLYMFHLLHTVATEWRGGCNTVLLYGLNGCVGTVPK